MHMLSDLINRCHSCWPKLSELTIQVDQLIDKEISTPYFAVPLHRKAAIVTINMVQAWFMDNEAADQRLPHHRNPPQYLQLDELYHKTGVEYFKINAEDYMNDAQLTALRKERHYDFEDEITCSEACLANYENMLKTFYTEHLHTDEEIRFILDGSGYFDVRDADDNWIRVAVSTGDLIIIPAGIYHRFTLDSNNYIKAKRYFSGEPKWLPYNRPADEMEIRREYLHKQSSGFQEVKAN